MMADDADRPTMIIEMLAQVVPQNVQKPIASFMAILATVPARGDAEQCAEDVRMILDVACDVRVMLQAGDIPDTKKSDVTKMVDGVIRLCQSTIIALAEHQGDRGLAESSANHSRPEVPPFSPSHDEVTP
jgi:hypothetical protein